MSYNVICIANINGALIIFSFIHTFTYKARRMHYKVSKNRHIDIYGVAVKKWFLMGYLGDGCKFSPFLIGKLTFIMSNLMYKVYNYLIVKYMYAAPAICLCDRLYGFSILFSKTAIWNYYIHTYILCYCIRSFHCSYL